MQLAKVIGTVVASRKEDVLEGMKFLVVRNCDFEGTPTGPSVVAVDAVGAGTGEVVLYASGSSARLTHITENRPVDATIMAIVDLVEVEGTQRYSKEGFGR
ncbi:MAG: EutN/CcmL family microcompartment protein [Deltaproteobacteria bacterium]|nr:EutN/CcmL family microcompartment protein [Deltaproteobacteria bacterium]